MSVKIADFGLSKFIPLTEGVKLFEKCGTPCYVAPEILREQGYNTKSDIFSLGSLMFNLLTGRFLFKGADKYELLAANKQCDLTKIPEYLMEYSPTCIDLVKLMLNPNPRVRPTARDALAHPWFNTDQEIIQDLLVFNDNLCRNSLAYLRVFGSNCNNNNIGGPAGGIR